MPFLDEITDDMLAAKPSFLMLSPGIGSLIAHKQVAFGFKWSMRGYGIIKSRRKSKTFREIAVSFAAAPITGKLTNPFLNPIRARHKSLLIQTARNNRRGIVIEDRPEAKGEGRSWITESGRYPLVIMYHEADKAGNHLDCHLGHLSWIYRVKPDLQAQLKFHKDGSLTNASKELLITHVRNEIANGSRTPQNLDHWGMQNTYTWLGHENGPNGYGAAKSRQLVSESTAEVYKCYQDGPIEFFAPSIHPGKSLYLYEIYHGEQTGVPILICGEKKHEPPKDLQERLHLKMIDPSDIDKLDGKVDWSTATAKEDGASCYIEVTPHGTTVWSPRISKRTGSRIEYSPKINGLNATGTNGTFNTKVVGMGELLFYREGKKGKREFLTHSETGGILNSFDLIPEDVKPLIVLYRIDKVGRQKTVDLPFWEMRELASEVVALNPNHLQLPELMSLDKARKAGKEGITVCKPGEGITTGYKIKLWGDLSDWELTSVDFHYSEKGNVAGVCMFKDPSSGREYALGPGQMGDRAFCEHLMQHPDEYVGSVAMVESRQGHPGRASVFRSWHLDKGIEIPI